MEGLEDLGEGVVNGPLLLSQEQASIEDGRPLTLSWTGCQLTAAGWPCKDIQGHLVLSSLSGDPHTSTEHCGENMTLARLDKTALGQKTAQQTDKPGLSN